MHSEVELCDIIRDSMLSPDEILEDAHQFHRETNPLRLADPFRKKRDDADWFEKDEDRSNENGEEGGDESMDVD
jgi:hypothetical protein